MKKLIIFIFAVTILGSCTKQQLIRNGVDPNLVGTWAYQTNKDNVLFFYNDNTLAYTWGNQYYAYGEYTADTENGTIRIPNTGIGSQLHGVYHYYIDANENLEHDEANGLNEGFSGVWVKQ